MITTHYNNIDINLSTLKVRVLETELPKLISNSDRVHIAGIECSVTGWEIDEDDSKYSWITIQPIVLPKEQDDIQESPSEK